MDPASTGTRAKTVSIERNVYFDTTRIPADDLEGEEDIELREIPSTPKAQPNPPTVPQVTPTPEAQSTVQPVVEETRSRRARKPSQWVLDLISGKGSVSARQATLWYLLVFSYQPSMKMTYLSSLRGRRSRLVDVT